MKSRRCPQELMEKRGRRTIRGQNNVGREGRGELGMLPGGVREGAKMSL